MATVDWRPWTADWSLVPFHFWSLVFFVFGCIVGSFLNVCIHRMPLGMSIVTPPSHCPHCKYSIPWYLNIPLVTWLALRGRCKNCGAPISPRYFIVELLTGADVSGLLAGVRRPSHRSSMPLALVYAVFLAGLIAATFIDFEHFIIPDEITFGGMAVGLVASFLFAGAARCPRADRRDCGKACSASAAGAGIIYAILRLGKLLFGRQRLKLPADTKIIFTETSVHLPDQEIPYDELFYRKSDVIALQARTVELVDRGYKDVTVRLALRSSWLEIGEERIDPDDVPYLEAVSAEIVLPREAMGLGDVKFMGGHRRVHRLAGRGVFADDQFDDRRGGGRCAHRHAAARMVVAHALRPLHRAGGGDLDFWRQANYPRHFRHVNADYFNALQNVLHKLREFQT